MPPDPAAAEPLPAVDEPSSIGGLGGHPRGLNTLFFTELWERFSYYGMRAVLILYMTSSVASGGMGMTAAQAAPIYGLYTGGVYFTAIPGGWIADKLLGLQRAVLAGGILIALGHYSLALNSRPMFYTGLVLIVLGTGLLKPNVSSIVGQLYKPEDTRRDAGFSIFYMGINLGAWISPLIVGFMAQDPRFLAWLARLGIHSQFGWHWGFGAAGLGMTLGVFWFLRGRRHLGRAGRDVASPSDNPAGTWALLALVLLAATALLWALWPYKDYVVLAGTAAFFWWLARQAQDAVERKRTYALIVLFVFATLFWAGFEQAGSSLNLFADRYTRTSILGWEYPPSWLQAVNAMFIWMLAPVFAWIWIRLGRHEPSSPAKFAYGLLNVGLGFLAVAWAAKLSLDAGGARVSVMWLIAVYLFHTIGELCLSPVGLSTVTKLAPSRLVGSMMGVWFLALSLGNFIGGRVAGLFETFPLPQLFGAVFLTTAGSALVLALLVRPISKLMGGVR
ncbi:MAG TPA: peptide MFS transporter [Vicinamibacteria bacterium]